MKKIRIFKVGMIVVCCIGVMCAKELKATAETVFYSRGNFVTDDGKVAFYKSDLDYLRNEITMLENEIDPSIMEQAYSELNYVSYQEKVQSKGIIDYDNGKMVLDARDVTELAAELDLLEKQYATSARSALNQIRTFIDASGDISHSGNDDEMASMPTLEQIREGICQSQSVDHLADTSPVIADNLTAGTAAWVNGKCIIGNGADNERAYKRGQEDGEDEKDSVDVEYIYHTHVNGRGEEVTEEIIYTLDNPGGCYVPEGHTHDILSKCETEYHPEKKCGHVQDFWDAEAGKYRCPYHGGDYQAEAGGSCSFVVQQAYTEWICGNLVNTWKLGCGKQSGQIEGCVITIRKK